MTVEQHQLEGQSRAAKYRTRKRGRSYHYSGGYGYGYGSAYRVTSADRRRYAETERRRAGQLR